MRILNSILTTSDEKYKSNNYEIVYSEENHEVEIEVYKNKVKQKMDGFGAAMTESSAYLISKSVKQEELLNTLFSKDELNISFVRTTIGASDFSLNNFTYCDIKDQKLTSFSIDRDNEYVIPMLKEALKINDFKIISSPWSAPAWMKNSKTMNGGSLERKYFKTYANYLSKFVIEYKKTGLEVYAITPQNEPLHEVNTYPTMYMTSVDQKDFIVELGKTFEEFNIETKIIAYDHNWDDINFSKSIYDDEIANKYVSGTAFHCYAGEVKDTLILKNAYPDKDIWFTECSGGEWATDFSDNLDWNVRNVFMNSISGGSKSVIYWNLVLDQNHGPINGGCLNCRGVLTLNTENNKIEKNIEYHILRHYTKFLNGESYFIESETNDDKVLINSFLNENDQIVLVIYNSNDKEKDILIKFDESKIQFKIPKKSLITLLIE